MSKITKEQIGKIQLKLGVILLILAIVGAYWVINQVFYLGVLDNGVSQMNTVWYNANNEIGEQTIDGAHQYSHIVIEASIYKVSTYLFGLGIVILLVQAVSLVLQGLKK